MRLTSTGTRAFAMGDTQLFTVCESSKKEEASFPSNRRSVVQIIRLLQTIRHGTVSLGETPSVRSLATGNATAGASLIASPKAR